MIEDFFEFEDWLLPGMMLVERWEYRRFKKYPSRDASEAEIMDFIKDAKRAEKRIAKDLVDDGMNMEDAIKEACQYPLKDDTPMNAIRCWIGYNNWLQDEANDGIDP